MKKIIVIFIVLFAMIAWHVSFGQRLESARPYLSVKGGPKKYYSTYSMKRFALENNTKSNQFRDFLLLRTKESDINSVFIHTRVAHDTTLEAGTYGNSGWNPVTQEFEPFVGKEYRGDVTVYESYKSGEYEKILLYKNECGNALGLDEEYNYETSVRERASTPKSEPKFIIPKAKITEYNKTVKQGKEDWSFRTPKNVSDEKIGTLNLPPVDQNSVPVIKHKFRIGWVVVPVATIAAGTLAYFIIRNNWPSKASSYTDNGGPVTPPGHDDDGGRVTNGGH